jgi:hypothetical protein
LLKKDKIYLYDFQNVQLQNQQYTVILSFLKLELERTFKLFLDSFWALLRS